MKFLLGLGLCVSIASWSASVALADSSARNNRGPNGNSNAGTFTTFDAPGAFRTQPSGINPAGTITGSYLDASVVFHGFLWTP